MDAGPLPDGWVGPDGDVLLDGGGWDGNTNCDPEPLPETAGSSCADAIDLGDLSDVLAESLTVGGNAVPAGRRIWWMFRATDDVDTAGDEFHVDVRFVVNGEDAYTMDVHRNSCSSVDALCQGSRGPFDWYTDQIYTESGCSGPPPCGEGNCVPTPDDVEGSNFCSDDTSVFYVMVQRADGIGACNGFTLEISNGLYSAP